MKNGTMLQLLNLLKAGQTFRELKSEEKWTVALAIILIVGVLFGIADGLVVHKTLGLRRQYAGGVGYTLIKAEMQWMVTATRIIFSVLLIPVALTIKSIVFHVFSRYLGGEGDRVFTTIHMMAYTYLPFIFKGVVEVYNGLTYQPPSYEEFVYQLRHPHLPSAFLREYNIFFLWAFILMVIAVRERYNINSKRAFLVVLIPYIAYWIVVAILPFGEF